MRYIAFSFMALAVAAGTVSAAEHFEGRTLISPFPSNLTYLIELDGSIAQTWTGASGPATSAHLLADGSIVRPSKVPDGSFPAPGAGGRIQRIDAGDNVVWDYQFSTGDYQHHHDLAPMPNGNVLLLAWERKSAQQAADNGRLDDVGEMWPTLIVEIEPVGLTGGNVVWEWHLWDHIIQDIDPARANFGVISEHPELIDINQGEVIFGGDWAHANAIDYNPELDQIVFSARNMNEFYVLDHSATTAEATGHTGGLSGMGGDILYRWGNPQIYGRGDEAERYFHVVHGVNWIDAGLPGAGHIIAYNNGNREGTANDYATVVEITPPMDGPWTYAITPGTPFGPAEPTWYYGDPGTFYGGPTQGSGQRLPNGNTLICAGASGNLFEVTAAKGIVWEYSHGEPIGAALRYATGTTSILADGAAAAGGAFALLSSQPNPFNPFTTMSFDVPSASRVTLQIYDVRGSLVADLVDDFRDAGSYSATWDGRDANGRSASSGTYFARMEAGSVTATRKLTLVR